MPSFRRAVVLVTVLAGAAAGSACDASGTGPDASDGVDSCVRHEECGELACIDGECVAAECAPAGINGGYEGVPEHLRCRSYEFCDYMNRCVLDPSTDQPECQIEEECQLGEFCYQGVCYAAGDLATCTSDEDCPCDEYCYLAQSVCVPRWGGCGLAEVFPELGCGPDELCVVETGECITPLPGSCETDGCPALQQCDAYGRCVQCLDDDDCGPGLRCSVGSGACVSDAEESGCTD